jgi:hypothetical protein
VDFRAVAWIRRWACGRVGVWAFRRVGVWALARFHLFRGNIIMFAVAVPKGVLPFNADTSIRPHAQRGIHATAGSPRS